MTPRVPAAAPPAFAPQPFFVARVTFADHPEYQFAEQWLEAGATALSDKAGGRYGGADDPGVSVTGVAFGEDDVVLVRAADGAGGIGWEVYPQTGGAAAGGDPVWTYNSLFTAVSIVPSSYTEVLRVSIPSDGVYLISTFMTAVLEHTAGSSVFATVHLYSPGGSFLFSWGGVASNFLQADGVSAGSSAWQFVYPMSAGGSARLMAAVLTPSGTPTVAKVYGLTDGDYPAPAPGVAGTYISAVKLPSHAGGSTVVPPPPPSPPPPTGAIIGGAKFTSPVAAVAGRTVTLSGATSATTATDAGGLYSFSGVNTGSNTVTLTLEGGETATYSVDGAGATAGSAAPVTVVALTTHSVVFQVTATLGTLVVTVDLGAGYTVTWSGGGTFVESPAGTHTLTGVTPATGGTVTLTGPGIGIGTTWTCDNPSTTGTSGTATADVDAGVTTTVAYTV